MRLKAAPVIHTIILALFSAMLLSACDRDNVSAEGSPSPQTYRFATFNIAMGLPEEGAMAAALESAEDPRLAALAAVLQKVRPDVVLLTEFDYDPSIDAAGLLNSNYMAHSQDGLEPIEYAYHYRPPVNTGVPSGLDLDVDGVLDEPEDAWGFGRFPGQYGMLVLSMYPLDSDSIRSFQTLPWQALPGALEPLNEDGTPFYPERVWAQLRLSSKNHVDVPIRIGDQTIHLLASHPTPPGFDGPENRNGKRNHDELSIWAHYLSGEEAPWLVDDSGMAGPLGTSEAFLIAGDLNADPADGGSIQGAIAQLLEHPAVDATCVPTSPGGAEAAQIQGGVNLQQRGDPAADTSDFNDERTGNLRIDYVLPARQLAVVDCGVLWPESTAEFHATATFSDHRLVWIDFEL